jgi:hypothetical protein
MRSLLGFLVLTGAVFAQDFRAVISGDVNDATGASIPGVRVIAQNLDRRVDYTAVTNEAGRYVTPFLPPGAYTVRFEKDGFKPLFREGLQLTAVDRINLNVQMQVGSISERVTVTAEQPLLQTETAVRSGTIGTKLIEDIPYLRPQPVSVSVLVARRNEDQQLLGQL